MPTVVAQGFLDQLLGPFKGLDVAAAYARYSGIIDFIIYALLFVGIAHVTIGKRFEGRGGRAITAGDDPFRVNEAALGKIDRAVDLDRKLLDLLMEFA